MDLAQQYRLGIMVTDPNVEKVASLLREQLQRDECVPEFQAEVLRCAEADFNAQMNRTRLYDLFQAGLKR
jgi:hypothetical protein